ncbi:hypothetical protein SpCBS45565_g01079 [Spizellomyces sp. 'palustris']|nr:hypothetical protein SpCBS45565_g01079 [Spizellomyces sp. 'palustris']
MGSRTTTLMVVVVGFFMLYVYFQYAAEAQFRFSIGIKQKENFEHPTDPVIPKEQDSKSSENWEQAESKRPPTPPGTSCPLCPEVPQVSSYKSEFAVLNTLKAPFNELTIAEHPTYGTCLLTDSSSTPVTCSSDEHIHHETLVHPALVLHPFPRRVLVVGGIVEAPVREVLKHFLVREITWVDQKDLIEGPKRFLPSEYGYEDPLKRVDVQNTAGAGYMRYVDHAKRHYDVIIIADDARHVKRENNWKGAASVEKRAEVIEAAQAALKPGGVLAVFSGEIEGPAWEDRRLLRRYFPRVFLGARYIPSVGAPVAYAYATRSEAPPDPGMLAPEYIDARLRRTTIGGTRSYDGLTHLHMFALTKDMRDEIDKEDLKAREISAATIVVGATPSELLHAPYEEVPFLDPVTQGETITREFYGCANEAFNMTNMKTIVEGAVEKMNGRLVFLNATELKEFKNSTGATKPIPMLSVVAMTEGGSITLHAWPNSQYAAADVTNFNNWAVGEEVMNHIFNELDATKSIGSTSLRGSLTRFASAPILDHVKYPVPYKQNPKVEFRVSPTAGSGNFAKETIMKGEIIFEGPIETYLLTKEEIRAKPKWLEEFMMHYGEQAEDGIFVGPPYADLDASYFTNHHCDANLWYEDYDIMVARREIAVGEELNFDYGTIYSDPEILDINPCQCGARNCRKHITGNDWKKAEVQEMHGLEHFWPHVQKKILKTSKLRKRETLAEL